MMIDIIISYHVKTYYWLCLVVSFDWLVFLLSLHFFVHDNKLEIIFADI